jgi:hypothetical protein
MYLQDDEWELRLEQRYVDDFPLVQYYQYLDDAVRL